MTEAIWLTLGLAIGGVAGWFFARAKAGKASADPIPKHPPGMEENEPYSLRVSVLTSGERAFFEVLRGVLPDEYSIFLKVRLGDLVNVTYGAGSRQAAYAQVCSKSLDFVICNTALSPVVAINLVDGSLGRNATQTRESIERVLAKVALPIEHIPLRPSYDEAEMRQHITKHVKLHSIAGDLALAAILA